MSSVRSLDRGCVQGSVLGPSLFSLYCLELESCLSEVRVISYADDSYVIVSAEDETNLINKLTRVLQKHFEFLHGLGMVVNQGKTELMFMQKMTNLEINIGSTKAPR